MRNKQTQSYPPKNVGFGFYLFILAIGAFLSSCGSKGFSNAEKILAAVPEKYKANPEEYILKSVEFSARLQNELDAAPNTRITEDIQKLILSKKNLQTYTRATAAVPPVIESNGVSFNLSSIMSSILLSQGTNNVQNLTFVNRGIYVEFGEYPEIMPQGLPVDPVLYPTHYSMRETAIIKYIKIDNPTTSKDTVFLKNSGGSIIADDFGTPCPRICPPN